MRNLEIKIFLGINIHRYNLILVPAQELIDPTIDENFSIAIFNFVEQFSISYEFGLNRIIQNQLNQFIFLFFC
jgi:hypothetical protein